MNLSLQSLVIYMYVHITCNMLAMGNLLPYVEINTSKWNIPKALYTQDHTHTIQGPHTIMDHTIVNHTKQWTNHQKIVDYTTKLSELTTKT
jgi:hypothetical protein